jgi:hypothetical protein
MGFVHFSRSFDDRKVLKEKIGYANVCSRMQDHRLKLLYMSNEHIYKNTEILKIS